MSETCEKLLKSLDCLLIENFTIQDKTLLEKLLTSLHNEDILLKNIPINAHCKWFAKVLEVYQQQTSESRNSLLHLYAFALKYLATLVKPYDNNLVVLIETRTLQSMVNLIEITSNLKESSIFNAYISLLQALNTHKRGIEYVLQEGLWKNIFVTINELIVPAKYIEIQSSRYIANLIYKTFEHEMAHCCEPLFKELFSKLCSTKNLVTNQPDKMFLIYNVYAKTLILLLDKFLGTKYQLDVCQYIIDKYPLSDVLVSIHEKLNVAPILLKNYTTLHLLFDCFTIWLHSDMNCILKSINSLMNTSKDIQSYKQINNLNILAIKYAKISNVNLVDSTMFERELLLGQLIPVMKCTEWLEYSNGEKFKFNNSHMTHSKSIFDHCDINGSMVDEVAISCILNILDVVNLLKQESLDYLITFFSTLLEYFLCSDNWIKQHQDQDYINNKFLKILSFMFLCWTKVIEFKEYNENVVHGSLSVPLVHRHYQFFDKPSHNCSLLQNSLKLISTALSKRIYENVLHKDNLIAFNQLCTTLNNLLLDTRPEIRDSCLECISSIIVVTKYSSGNFLIELALEKQLSVAVLNTLKHDNDPFVKAKALECLEKMVSVPEIWEKSLKESDLMVHCLNLMQYESEGIIRRQIVNLITALFNYNELSNELFNEICIIMVHISIKDPLWEVKTFTYEFWNSVVHKFIRKTFIPNNSQILKENLAKLSATGCLQVLYIALKEDYDLMVQKKAIGLTKELLSLISSSNISDVEFQLKNESINSLSSVKDDSESFSCPKEKKMRQIDSTDIVLNSITTMCDSELLSSLKFTSSNIYPKDVNLHKKTDIYISADDFLSFVSVYDFNDYDAKKQWVLHTRSGLDSMLDDIISQSQNCFIEGADIIDCH